MKKEPKITCPHIDSVLTLMESLQTEANFSIKHLDHMDKGAIEQSFSEIITELNKGFDIMEEIRSANEGLREWGHEWRRKAQEL